jgi:hypothetical protein
VLGKYIIDPVYEAVELVWGDGHIVTYSEADINLHCFETGEVVASITRPEKDIEIYRSEHGFIVYKIEDSWELGVMDMSGTVITPARYYEVALTPNGECAVFHAESNCSYLLNDKGEVLSVYKDMALTEYILSFDCWLYSENYASPGIPTYGLMKSNGEIWYEPFTDSIRSYDLDKNCAWLQMMQDIHHEAKRSPVIFGAYEINESEWITLGTGILSTSGILDDVVYSRLVWLANQEVVVATEKDGDMGILSWDGAIIFEPRACEINFKEEGSNRLFTDTEHLIFSEIGYEGRHE